jgi:hypothetical protein
MLIARLKQLHQFVQHLILRQQLDPNLQIAPVGALQKGQYIFRLCAHESFEQRRVHMDCSARGIGIFLRRMPFTFLDLVPDSAQEFDEVDLGAEQLVSLQVLASGHCRFEVLRWGLV